MAERPGADRPADRSGAPDPSLIAAAIARAGIGFEATEHGRTCWRMIELLGRADDAA
jgi:hypothetical protein